MPYSYELLIHALADAGIQEAPDEAACLLSHFCHVSRASLFCDRTRVYDAEGLDEAVEKRLTRYPLQYILGSWNFGGCTFRVDGRCLIPRPDTEVLVEEAIRSIRRGGLVADLCTGSGCIAVTLLRHRPDLTCAALELYPETLALATENAVRNGVRERFIPVQADLLDGGAAALEGVVHDALHARAPGSGNTFDGFDAILSTPPYIRRGELAGLAPEPGFEPTAALDGGEDGLIFYRAILSDYRYLLKVGGLLMLEIGFDQADDLARLTDGTGGFTGFRVIQDLGGRDRVVVLTRTA